MWPGGHAFRISTGGPMKARNANPRHEKQFSNMGNGLFAIVA